MASVPPRSRGALGVHRESYFVQKFRLPVASYIHTEQIGAIALLLATIAALVWANWWSDSYHEFWETVLIIDLDVFIVSESLEGWVNDGLMAIFFFVVGLEIKRELFHGQLSSLKKASLPILAAFGGMLGPALIYFAFTAGGEGDSGWGIPMATDIAFALGVLGLLGRRLPSELRIVLLGLAVVDDIGAILVIAIFYTDSLDLSRLAIAGALVVGIVGANWLGVRNLVGYIVLGALVWVAVLKSGVHATIAGVVLGFLTPATAYFNKAQFAESMDNMAAEYKAAVNEHDDDRAEVVLGQIEELSAGTESPLERLERLIHPWTAFLILPVFALANAGIELSGDIIRDAAESSVTIGVVVGLLAGKTVGIFGISWLAVRLGIAELPSGVRWSHILGVGMLAGIGFTVAIFISGLAFNVAALTDEAKIGILAASIVAGLVGYLFLLIVSNESGATE